MKPFLYETALAPPNSPALGEDIHAIGCGEDDRTSASAQTMGFKAWNLLRMAALGLPVPPAIVLGTSFCADPARRAHAADPALWRPALCTLEAATGTRLGDPKRPLLLSVRSGAPVSMPGMMETLLNVGLCDRTVEGLTRLTGNPRLAWDAYRRLVAGYGEVVAGIPATRFEAALNCAAQEREEPDLDFAELRALTRKYLDIYVQEAGRPFPQEPAEQVTGAIAAVLDSWQSPKAREYRRINAIPDHIGTAVTLQAMVFGNAGGRSGSGVGFTRDPASGEPGLWVDFLFNAQGEDVVSGRRNAHGHDQLAQVLPAVWEELRQAAQRLEQALGDMQDFEFTVQEGRLFLLQTRSGKRTPLATARIALDLWEEGLISADQARARTANLDPGQLLQTRLVTPDGAPPQPLARTASASNGIAQGEIALDEARATARAQAGAPVILVRQDAETSDITALEQAAGLLTQRGARTAHAAVVARQLGKVCLVGCQSLTIDLAARTIQIGERVLEEGAVLTLDGNTGAVFAGAVETEQETDQALLERLARLGETP